MNTETLFIEASRNKYRFVSSKGHLATEDLWDLSLTALDPIAVYLDEQIQKAGRKSFIGKRSTSSTEDEAKLEIVKVIIAAKQAEAEAKKIAADKKSQKDFLNALLEKKKLEQLEGLSVEQIQAQLDQLS